MNCVLCVKVDLSGGLLFVGAPIMHSMFGLSMARHVHGVVGHMHWNSQCGIVLSYGLDFWWPAFMRGYCLVYLFDLECMCDWSVCRIDVQLCYGKLCFAPLCVGLNM